MKSIITKAALAACMAALAVPAFADNNVTEGEETKSTETTSLETASVADATEATKPTYGINVTDFASKPKFGAYIIGTYKYSSLEGANGGPGFGVRLVRAYVDGSIFNDFKYRLQVELNGTPHIKDFYIEWAKYKEFSVKIGQFKRAFTFENPYNPWDVGVGDYSMTIKKLAGFGDRCGEASTGGRDEGIQFQGDLFPVGADKHRLIHYQLGIYNGNGINKTDNNATKDIIGTIQVQPIKDLYLGVFGWKGNWNNGTVTVDRNRYAISGKYEHNNWSARAEYVHSFGYKASSIDTATGKPLEGISDKGLADAFYATAGVPVLPWLKIYAKYDTYREYATWDSAQTVYSICPNFRLHKNLNFQIEYRFDQVRATGKNYHELWFEYYVRF